MESLQRLIPVLDSAARLVKVAAESPHDKVRRVAREEMEARVVEATMILFGGKERVEDV